MLQFPLNFAYMFMNILCTRGEVTDYGCRVLSEKYVCEVGKAQKLVSFVEFQASFFLKTGEIKIVPKL